VLLAGLLPVACSDAAGSNGYSEANRDAFVTACTDSAADDRLVRDVCECTYEEVESSLPYEEFVELEESLRIDSLMALPDEVAEMIADCVLTEADL
jgi:hypothetical protein